MDELQARIRAIRSLQTDMNLARQPQTEFEYPSDAPTQGEANVVELPNRQAQLESQSEPSQAPRSRTKRKPATASKQKATAAGTAKTFPFRQMRDSNQQPFIDELKRLEAQAERINQLLAERARKKAHAEQAGEAATELPQSARGKASTASSSSTSKKKSAKGARQTQRSPQREILPMPTSDDDTEALEAQAERIKQLLADLEAALTQGETTPITQTEAPAAEAVNLPSNPPPANVQASSIPGIDSLLTDGHRSGASTPSFSANRNHSSEPDVQKAQQEAAETAQALRYLAGREVTRERLSSPIAEPTRDRSRRDVPRSRPSRSTTKSFSLQRWGLQLRGLLQIPLKPIDRIGDAVLWIVMAAVVRVGARFLLAMFPTLAPIFMVLMFAPAAFAVYLALFVPKAGFVSIYRLFLIMLGLLIGGRL